MLIFGRRCSDGSEVEGAKLLLVRVQDAIGNDCHETPFVRVVGRLMNPTLECKNINGRTTVLCFSHGHAHF